MSGRFELGVTRLIQASPEAVWKIYVERTVEWFCPRPWTTPVVDWDLRTGGRANVEMQSPEGERHAYSGIFLEVVHGRRLVSTGALTEGWVPQAGEMNFVRIDTFEPEGEGTRYTAVARHWDEKAMQTHRAMGFEKGWGAVADQLAELAETNS
ncbi:MAG: SRPBCC family protein [Brevundimonas sp.]|uniref:SRPBCC family protein n=1 Tax=Brevundimonas sp. TaxID=1871086 RepID=UPI00256A82D9|nr:SRPBCC family protein [Brevundimonas sp.]MDK2748600.1 SRPBCC family protein [Brevundimonas sp.]